MAGFRFFLQKVLELRERNEAESARRLVLARAASDEARRARSDLEAVRDAGRTRLTNAHGSGGAVGHLQNMAYVLGKVDEHIEDASAAVTEADEELVETLKHYHEAHRQRQTIDQLRERKLDEWRVEEKRHERKAMDEVAINRHARSGPGASAAGG